VKQLIAFVILKAEIIKVTRRTAFCGTGFNA
jgi:hypothetical protein